MRIIAYWNESAGLRRCKVTQPPTKVLLQTMETVGEVLDGKFLTSWPPYSVQDIIRAIDGFKLRFHPDYLPYNKRPLKTTGLKDFFWNSFSNRSSWFQECLNNPPQLLKSFIPRAKELNPQLTKWLKKIYCEKIFLGQPKRFTPAEENRFIHGANRLHKSIPNLRQRANLMTDPYEWCEYVVDALVDKFGRDGVVPGNIGSDWTYDELLPQYLERIGRID